LRRIDPRIDADVFRVLTVERSVASRVSFGGTAPKNVLRQARAARKRWLR
jgi:argininosuccinate lyase